MGKFLLGASAIACTALAIGMAQAARTDATPALHRVRAVSAPQDGSLRRYIVRLEEAPAATYAGGLAGYAATDAHVRNERILNTHAAASYIAYLDDKQSALLKQGSEMLGRSLVARYRYHLALNGLSVELTPAEAQRLSTLPGVVSVRPVEYRRPLGGVTITAGAPPPFSSPASAAETNASRSWVNAAAAWQLPTNGTDNEGEGIVVADVDTGINHANVSFAVPSPGDAYAAQDPTGLRFGVCDPNNHAQNSLSTPVTCNDKLIGAYSYTHGPNDPYSPEDSEGHGSHTASTAAGDFVQVSVNGSPTYISGMAPHASIIAYDVCDPTDLCGEDDSVAAVEQAIKDQATIKGAWGNSFKGMVLNFSIGGSADPYGDSVEQAFLSAEEAGIYVSVAGGNGGPANIVVNDPINDPVYPVQHLGPWVATLAAATHDGTFTSNDVVNFGMGDAATRPAPGSFMVGAGDSGPTPFGGALIVYAGSGDYDNDDPVTSGTAPTSGTAYPSSQGKSADARQCLYPFKPNSFPVGTIVPSNTIVVCDRGTIPLVDKAYNAMQGGAGGVIIASTSASNQDMPIEPYVIPGTLINTANGDSLRAWLQASHGVTPEASAAIGGSTLTTDASGADQVAGFSSRGPNGDRFDSLVKPDLTAPGVSVLAAVGDPGYADGCSSCSSSQPQSFDFYDGTSMAAPHDAGAAALLKQAHPSWTPSEVKSALMLTAVTIGNGTSPGVGDQCASLDSGSNCVASPGLPSPQVRGAGRLDVDAADRTALVMDESGADYAAADPAKGGDLTTLNLASLGNAACSPGCTWKRTVTSAFSSATVNYTVSVTGLSTGLQVHVTPSSFSLAPHQSRQLLVSADSSALPAGQWAFGEVDVSTGDSGDGGAAVPAMHLPIALQATVPVPLMNLDVTSLDYTVAAGKSAVDRFTIKNAGEKTLTWSLAVNGGAGTSSFSCAKPHGMEGLSFDHSSGKVPADTSGTVAATFDAKGLSSGVYSGIVCVSGDASNNPVVPMMVTVRVTGGDSNGGGGGDFGLFGLASLLLAWRRRRLA